MIHRFAHDITGIPLPERFTYPYCYTPHPLAVAAAEELQEELRNHTEWREILQEGKMFGVLVMKDHDGSLGYITAFSGILAGKNLQPGFAPPVYDLQNPDGFFLEEEKKISALSAEIDSKTATQSGVTHVSDSPHMGARGLGAAEIAEYKEMMKVAKAQRDERRKHGNLTPEEERALILESQHQKAELKRMQKRWLAELAEEAAKTAAQEAEINALKEERRRRSAALQERLFRQFRFLNILGESRDLLSIFQEETSSLPPAGAGECAAPRMLQYAFENGLTPLCMAEFWWGDSPKTEIRHHLYYYPSCRGKCKPILGHMLKGMSLDPNPLKGESLADVLRIVHEDDSIVVVDKPAGMLAVQGKIDLESVESILRKRYPEVEGPMIVHRLDQATSGLMVLVKNKEVHKNLQAQFADRTVKKRYIAILEGEVKDDHGTISLPICPDPDDRPRQIVSEEYGKPAITSYKVLDRKDGRTRVAFFPHTGRTHQLRVHASHILGLNAPIVGDYLYGQPSDRLYLHAESISFIHPATGFPVRYTAPAPF